MLDFVSYYIPPPPRHQEWYNFPLVQESRSLGEYWQNFYLSFCISHFVDCFQYSIFDSIMDVKHCRRSSLYRFSSIVLATFFWVAWHSLHHFFKVVPLGNTKQHCSTEIRDTNRITETSDILPDFFYCKLGGKLIRSLIQYQEVDLLGCVGLVDFLTDCTMVNHHFSKTTIWEYLE